MVLRTQKYIQPNPKPDAEAGPWSSNVGWNHVLDHVPSGSTTPATASCPPGRKVNPHVSADDDSVSLKQGGSKEMPPPPKLGSACPDSG